MAIVMIVLPAQGELLVLLAVIAAGVAYVVVRVRRGALEEERARRDRAGDEGGDAEVGDGDGGDGA